MLSQRVALDTIVAILGQTKADEDVTSKYRKSAQSAVELWSSSRIDLVEGNGDLSIPTETDGSILDAFDVLDGYSDQMIAGIEALLEPISGDARVLSDVGVVKELLALTVLSLEYLTRMNAITDDYQTISDDRISNLLLIELIVLCFTGLILIVEIIFVVIPSVRHAIKTTKALRNEGKNSTGFSKLTAPRIEVKAQAPEEA
jgi:two-component system sensor histidine kinase DegS